MPRKKAEESVIPKEPENEAIPIPDSTEGPAPETEEPGAENTDILEPQQEQESAVEKEAEQPDGGFLSSGDPPQNDLPEEEAPPETAGQLQPAEDSSPRVPDSADGALEDVQTSAKSSFYQLNFRNLDRDLSPTEAAEWEAIYASYRAKSSISGPVIGLDENVFAIRNRNTRETERKTLRSLVCLNYRVKVLIPETEVWMRGEEKPDFLLNAMRGAKIEYVIMDVDREGNCAIASRRMALAGRRWYFGSAPRGHREGELLKCNVIAVGAKRCLVECNGYDVMLTQRDLSYAAIENLRSVYHPGDMLDCRLKEYDKDHMVISVKEVDPNPFDGADGRHPVGCQREAKISSTYAGGIFCTLIDNTVVLCLYNPQSFTKPFKIGDRVLVSIKSFDYNKELVYGKIVSSL